MDFQTYIGSSLKIVDDHFLGGLIVTKRLTPAEIARVSRPRRNLRRGAEPAESVPQDEDQPQFTLIN